MDRILIHLGGTTTDIEIECWGGNFLKMQNRGTGYGAIIASTPHSRYDTTIYIVVVRQGKAGQMALMRHIEMSIARILVKQFLKPDFAVLNTMRPNRGWMLDSNDYGLVQFLKYWRQLPRWTGFEIRRRDLASFNLPTN